VKIKDWVESSHGVFQGTIPELYWRDGKLTKNLNQDSQYQCHNVEVTLRPTVSRPVSPGVKPHLGPRTRFLLLSDTCGFVEWGVLSNERAGLSFVAVIAVHDIYIYRFTCRHSTQSFVKSPVPCGYILFSFICNSSIYVCTIYTRPLSV
jgi:hypothetical protein